MKKMRRFVFVMICLWLGNPLWAQFSLYRYFDFSKENIDIDFWNFQYPWGRTIVSNFELQYYLDRNVYTENGVLVLEVKREPYMALVDSFQENEVVIVYDNLPNERLWNYTSGMICSREQFLYGRFSIRARMPKGKGAWPAFWLINMPPYSEIDVFEYRGDRKRQLQTHYHYENENGRGSSGAVHRLARNLTKRFHDYSCEWTPGKVKWFLDGWKIFEAAIDFNIPMHLIANLAVGSGIFTGPPNGRKPFNPKLEIESITIETFDGNK